jgi:hypothetical protein
LAESGLKASQVINVYKTFVLPMTDYSIMSSVVSLMELEKVDQLIRNKVNELIDALPIKRDAL